MIEVSHISSVHHYNDSRIVKRMVTSLLSQKTFKVKWVAQQASLSDLPGDVCFDLPKVKGKIWRMLYLIPRVFHYVRVSRSDYYHLHDPELFLLVYFFRSKKFILDIHENYWISIENKQYIPLFLRSIIQSLVRAILDNAVKRAEKVVVAWPSISDEVDIETFVIQNYPSIVQETDNDLHIKSSDELTFLYSGLICFDRGFKESLEVFKKISKSNNCRFILIGRFKTEHEKRYFHDNKGDENIHYYEWMNQKELYSWMRIAHFGFIFFKDLPNHRYSVPNKLFEYIHMECIPLLNDLPFLSTFNRYHSVGLTGNICNLDDFINKIQKAIDNGLDDFHINHKLIKNSFTWKSQEKEFLHLYK